MKIALSTDTSCGISKKLATELNIKVFPLNVIIDGEEFLDGLSINQDELLIAMKSNKKIKTSTPPTGVVIDYFEKLFKEGYDLIIHFTISSKLSSMNSLFNEISKNNFENKIIVIDSFSVCSSMLSQLLYTYEALQDNLDIETIKKELEKRKDDSQIYFIPENLTALKNGGRISPAVAALCNLIGIKPVLHFSDGALEKDTVTKNLKKYLHERIEELAKSYSLDNYDYTIASFSADQTLLDFTINEIKLHQNVDVTIVPVPINVCAHCGPGTLGLIVSKKLNKKSLHKYLEIK